MSDRIVDLLADRLMKRKAQVEEPEREFVDVETMEEFKKEVKDILSDLLSEIPMGYKGITGRDALAYVKELLADERFVSRNAWS